MEAVAFWAGFVLASWGIFLVVIAAYVSLKRRNDPALAHLDSGSPRVADRADDGPVSLRGTVRPVDGATVREPMSRHDAVWYRVEAYETVGSTADSSRYVQVLTERDARDFLLDDGSARPALVATDDAGYVTTMHQYGGTIVLFGRDDLPYEQHDLTDEHVAAIRDRCGDPKLRVTRVDRYSVEPGETVTVVGWLQRSESGQPVVVARPPDHPLLVYGVAEDVLRRDRAVRSRNRKRIAIVGVVFLVIGAAGMWWGG